MLLVCALFCPLPPTVCCGSIRASIRPSRFLEPCDVSPLQLYQLLEVLRDATNTTSHCQSGAEIRPGLGCFICAVMLGTGIVCMSNLPTKYQVEGLLEILRTQSVIILVHPHLRSRLFRWTSGPVCPLRRRLQTPGLFVYVPPLVFEWLY